MEITTVEMYSGIGGMRLGLEKANQIGSDSQQRIGAEERRSEPLPERGNGRVKQEFRCVWANDNDKYACQIYRKNFGSKELVEADIRTIDPSTIPNHRLLTAGFPCQSFSLAGKRRGFEDTRGTLFYEIARVASVKRPPLLLLENVKGLLSNDGGRTFTKILQTLDELGYWYEWQVLNSKHFGVPQNRERVFIIGHLRGADSRQILSITEASEIASGTQAKAQREGTRVRIAHSLNVGGSGRERNLIANTLRSRYHKNGSENLIQVGELWKGSQIRRLTPTECERLQGFPDGWTEGVSDTQRYKLLGNAVTVNVVEFLGRRLLGCLR